MHPNTAKKAAWEGSPGTAHDVATGRPGCTVTLRPSRSSTLTTPIPDRDSIISVVGRVRTFSTTVVGPDAHKAAKRIADLTCALAIGTS